MNNDDNAQPAQGAGAAAAAANNQMVNQLETIFSNPKADIPVFYGDKTRDSVTAKFMYDRIIIAQATYRWSDTATAGNFKLALRGKAIDWLNFIKDTERVDVTLWSTIEPLFKSHYDIQVQTVDNVWDLSKLKHEERDDPADLKLEVSKLINNVSSTAPDFEIEIKQNFTLDEVKIITRNATQNLKTHLMKTLFINKLAPSYKEYVLSQEPLTLNDATNTARAMWKRKHPVDQLPKMQTLSMNPVTASIEDTLNTLPEDIREECIAAIRNKRNNAFRNNQQGNNTQNTYSGYQGSNNGQSTNQNKGQKKKNKNSATSNYESVTCWFCNKKGHTQIECRTRIRQNKPMTWKNKEIKSKFHAKKILVITDFGDMDEAREWREKIETEAKLPERPTNGQDFQ
jgi:hypothetical protein